MTEHAIALHLIGLAEKAKAKSFHFNDILSNSEDITNSLDVLKKFYREVLLIDLDYALHVKVHDDLWKHGFANYIEPLYERLKRTISLLDPELIEVKALLTEALADAKVFYLTLLEEFRVTFDLDLICELDESKQETFTNPFKDEIPKRTVHYRPKKSSLLHICMEIYTHLGDIAIYYGNLKEAAIFCRYALCTSPVSATFGQAYNQLGLLYMEGNSDWDFFLTAVYFFTRGSGVANPSQAAISNLSRSLAKCAKGTTKINKYVNENQDENKKRKVLTPQECLALFLKVHGLIHVGPKDLVVCEKIIPWLIESWEAWATERAKDSSAEVLEDGLLKEGSQAFCRMFLIDLFALHKIQERSKSKADAAQPDEADQRAKAIILDLIAGSLHAALQPISCIQRDDIPRYFALPFVKLALDWIRNQPDVMTEPAFTSRPRIWTNICAILRVLQKGVPNTDFAKLYPALPLPEDLVLQGFIPFMAAISIEFEFGTNEVLEESLVDAVLRCKRMFPFLHWFGSFQDALMLSMCLLRSCRLLQHREWLAEKEELGFRRESNGDLAFVDCSAAMPVPACSDQGPVGGAKSKKNKKKE